MKTFKHKSHNFKINFNHNQFSWKSNQSTLVQKHQHSKTSIFRSGQTKVLPTHWKIFFWLVQSDGNRSGKINSLLTNSSIYFKDCDQYSSLLQALVNARDRARRFKNIDLK